METQKIYNIYKNCIISESTKTIVTKIDNLLKIALSKAGLTYKIKEFINETKYILDYCYIINDGNSLYIYDNNDKQLKIISKPLLNYSKAIDFISELT